MTKREFNADVKKLYSAIEAKMNGNQDEYFKYIESEARKEFLRLYDADRELEYCTLLSLKILLDLNRRFRWVALHQFGNGIKF